MSEFDRPLAGSRLVDVLHGDTLQEIAARELGNAARWVDIANINNLRPPYITDDPAEASDRVLLSGGVLLVPARPTPTQQRQDGTTEAEIYGTDLALDNGQLRPNENGDLKLVSGRENLKQALIHRIHTERGELIWHPTYGSLVRSLLGATNGPSSGLLAAQYVAAAMRADYRVKEVASTTAAIVGDQVRVECDVVPIVGRSQKIEAII